MSRHKDAIPAADLILEFGLASLAGYEYLQDLNWVRTRWRKTKPFKMPRTFSLGTTRQSVACCTMWTKQRPEKSRPNWMR